MSFYVTLPSNSSMEFYPNNTLTNFTTQLKVPLKFNCEFEVALVEITFSHGWIVELGNLHFESKNDDLPSVEIPIFHNDGERLTDFISNINDRLHDTLLKKIFWLDHNKLDMENLSKENFIKDYRNKKMLPEIIIEKEKLLLKEPEKTNLVFDKPFLDLFGVQNNISENNFDAIDLLKFDKNLFLINTLYVYSDIIKYQFVGDTLAPLLRTVHVPNNFHIVNNITFDSPHYIPLSNLNINSINISIRDDTGASIHFLKGKTIVKLHFRPMRYGF